MTVVPRDLPAEKSGKTYDLRNWYMPHDLHQRLDAARARRYPKASTREFAMWLLGSALTEYEAAEQRASQQDRMVLLSDEIDRTRLVDTPPQHRILVRE
jgi:hypothetical protein